MSKSRWGIVFCMIVVLCGACFAQDSAVYYGVKLGSHRAVTPVTHTEIRWWMPRHQEVLDRVAKGDVGLLMIGDSITHGWNAWKHQGQTMWDRYYAPRNAVNLGFGADRTEHVLWRLLNGEIDSIHPKLAVLLIGTNNGSCEYTAEQVADGIKAIVGVLRRKLPETKILMLAIFPRGDGVQAQDKEHGASRNAEWDKNAQASLLASEIADGKMIFYLDINNTFLDENGVLPREIMPDLLHPNKKGYQLWAEAMEPTLIKLMGAPE